MQSRYGPPHSITNSCPNCVSLAIHQLMGMQIVLLHQSSENISRYQLHHNLLIQCC